MRVVLDTNIIVSGLLWDKAPSLLMVAALEGRIEIFTSETLLFELEDVLPRRKFARRILHSGLSVAQVISRFTLLAQRVVPADISPVLADPDDDHVLACALSAGADLIVSGDSDLLNLKSYKGIPIVEPVAALDRIARG